MKVKPSLLYRTKGRCRFSYSSGGKVGGLQTRECRKAEKEERRLIGGLVVATKGSALTKAGEI